MKKADLHVHTTFSDGKMTPYEVIKEAYHRDLAAVGITDHDTLGGIVPAINAGEIYGVEVVPGVELSTYFAGKELHILGYYCRAGDSLLHKTLILIRQARHKRMIKMLALLQDVGIKLELEEVLAFAAGGESLGRPHLAELLCLKGYCKTPAEAFRIFLGEGKPAYVKRAKLGPAQAIRLIRRSGGVAVLAHPGIYREEGLIPLLCEMGLCGIEAFHPDHRLSACRRFYRMGRKYNLVITGGSDFHGQGFGASSAPGAVAVSYDCVQKLKKSAEA